MEKVYNLYNLIDFFRKWLIAEKKLEGKGLSKATLKNYASDLKHFLGWSILKLKSKNPKLNLDQLSPSEFISLIDASLIKEYRDYLVLNKIPLKTVNRRLSTLRKFFSFCIDQDWIKQNPAKEVKNVGVKKAKHQEENLKGFFSFLKSKGYEKEECFKVLQDVEEFFEVVKSSN